MARIRGVAIKSDQHRAELTDRLLTALTDQSSTGGPVVFEIPIDRSDTYHVIVVWDRWAEVPPGDRSEIIAEAYRELDETGLDEPISEKITTSLGVTPQEAVDYGLLPYVVQPHHIVQSYLSLRDPRLSEILETILAEGAIETPDDLELLLPTMPMAQRACDRLRDLTARLDPEIRWMILQSPGRYLRLDYDPE